MQIKAKRNIRKLIHNDTGHIFPDDFVSSHIADLERKERIYVADLPKEIVDRYSSLSRDALIEIARSPDQHRTASCERQMVYRLRAAFGCSFPSETGVSHIFHPGDSTTSKLGTEMLNTRQQNAARRAEEKFEVEE